MAPVRSKKKAKSGSKKSGSKKTKKPAVRKASKAAARPKKSTSKAKKPAAKKKVVARASKPKKVVAAKAPKPPKAVKAPVARAKKVLAPEVSNALAQAEVEGLISRLPPPVQPVVKLLRKVVLEVAPEASEQIENGAPAYFANGVFARIEPGEHDVLVRFLKGEQLPSASELNGDALAFSSVEDLKETVLRKVVREAVMLNLSNSASPSQA